MPFPGPWRGFRMPAATLLPTRDSDLATPILSNSISGFGAFPAVPEGYCRIYAALPMYRENVYRPPILPYGIGDTFF